MKTRGLKHESGFYINLNNPRVFQKTRKKNKRINKKVKNSSIYDFIRIEINSQIVSHLRFNESSGKKIIFSTFW
jgi:hypothetical protein